MNARDLWLQIPEESRILLLGNVFCGKCREAVTMGDYSVRKDQHGLLLEGKCTTCSHDVARVVELEIPSNRKGSARSDDRTANEFLPKHATVHESDEFSPDTEVIKELTLLLLFLTSREENEHGRKYRRSRKEYPLDILKEFIEEGLMLSSTRAQSVWFTEEGLHRAEMVLEKWKTAQKP